MRVNQNSNPALAEQTKTSKTQTPNKTAGVDRARSNVTDAVGGDVNTEISARAREMASAKEAASSAPDVREKMIAELKERIANKQYNVKPEAIAERMVEEHALTRDLG